VSNDAADLSRNATDMARRASEILAAHIAERRAAAPTVGIGLDAPGGGKKAGKDKKKAGKKSKKGKR
jgi:hypothetical protein